MPLNAAAISAAAAKMRGARERANASTLLGDVATAIQASAVADLNQDISASYTEAEVQAISDKVDELLAALRASEILAT